jgi:hypothetical protein
MARNVGDDAARLHAVEVAARTLVDAVFAYDAAIERVGSQSDRGGSQWVEGDDLDALYERWIAAAHELNAVLQSVQRGVSLAA